MFARLIGTLAVVLVSAMPAFGQSQAINGTIEGTIVDSSGGVLPGVTVVVTNTDTGASRSVITNESGVFRAPLLALGTYMVSAELSGFRKFEQRGISLAAGQTAVVNISMTVGEMSEVVSVTADSPVVDLGKIDQGRTLNEREIRELPLTSRNPYNFALLQPGIVGFETQEFGVPRLTANGALLRVNYQIDGNDNTEKDRAGLRQMPMSEIMIREVKVVTTGYAPEFGQTMGLVYNAITPSGTNAFRGQGSYRFQRKPMVSLPFFTTTTTKPPTDVNIFTADSGGPIVKDRTFYFAGFENTKRDFSGGRVITINPASATRIGLTEPGYMPAVGDTKFAIGKVDHQFSQANRFTVRYIFFDNSITNNVGGGLNSVQWGTDFKDRQHSTAAQLVSTIGSSLLNEARVQYATRTQSRVPGDQAGTGPGITIERVANFGGPVGGNADAGFGFTEGNFQLLDNFTYLRGDHSYKFGFNANFVNDSRTQTQIQLYTFSSIDNYLLARSGANPRAYSTFAQFFGEPSYEYKTQMYAFFVQDDWRLTSNFKLLYGVRYDVYTPPDGIADAPIASSREFSTDTSNWQPRGGFVWTLGANQRTVVRGSSGLMYDQPLNAIYEQALVNNGTAIRGNVTFSPTTAGAPSFPNVVGSGSLTPSNTAWTVDPDFEIARMWQNNVQLEHQIADRYSASIGFSYTRGSSLPVVTNVNPINPTGSLPDGRPIFSTAVSAATRQDPRFNALFATQAIGESTYRALTMQFARRFMNGIQWDFAYTLGKSEDNAPIPSTLSVQGDAGRSDMTNLDHDKGPNILDQRHTLVGSIVARPEVSVENPVLHAILNNNQFGVAILLASGIPVNVRSNRELSNDAVASDRPTGVGRNSLNLPARKNVDFRYTRGFALRGTSRVEVLAELKNIFNTVQWASVNSVVQTDAQGNPLTPLPSSGGDLPATSGYEQRQFQLGFKFLF